MRRTSLVVIVFGLLAGSGAVMGQVSIPRPRVAFVDLVVKGEVGIPGAGEVLAELLLTEFPGKRYQPVERSQFSAILKEQDLTVAVVRDAPEKAYAKLKGVSYLVVGSISKLKAYTLTARVVDVATGDIVQQAEMSAEAVDDLGDCVTEVGKLLEMTGDEKKAYLDEKQFATVLEQARAKVSEKDFDKAAALYRRCLAIKPDAAVATELRKAKEEIDKALRASYGKITIVAAANTNHWVVTSSFDCLLRDAIKEAHRRNGVKVTADFGKAATDELTVSANVEAGKYSEAAGVAKKLNAHVLLWVHSADANNAEVRAIAADTGEELLSRTYDITGAKITKESGTLVKDDSPVFAQIFKAVMQAWREHSAGK